MSCCQPVAMHTAWHFFVREDCFPNLGIPPNELSPCIHGLESLLDLTGSGDLNIPSNNCFIWISSFTQGNKADLMCITCGNVPAAPTARLPIHVHLGTQQCQDLHSTSSFLVSQVYQGKARGHGRLCGRQISASPGSGLQVSPWELGPTALPLSLVACSQQRLRPAILPSQYRLEFYGGSPFEGVPAHFWGRWNSSHWFAKGFTPPLWLCSFMEQGDATHVKVFF